MTTSEELKAKARALRNPKNTNPNAVFDADEHTRKGKKAGKPQEGAKKGFRKPSV